MTPVEWEAMTPFEREALRLILRGVQALEALVRIEKETLEE